MTEAQRVKVRQALMSAGFIRTSASRYDPERPGEYTETWMWEGRGPDVVVIRWGLKTRSPE